MVRAKSKRGKSREAFSSFFGPTKKERDHNCVKSTTITTTTSSTQLNNLFSTLGHNSHNPHSFKF